MLPILLAATLMVTTSCGALVEYSDQLINENTGRSGVVTKPASLAGLIGFVAGVPVDIAALPITYVVYSVQKDADEERVDPLSILLFPSFLLWRTSVLAVGTPLDILEFVFYRAWKSPTEKTQSDRDKEETRSERAKGAACIIGTGSRFSSEARGACRLPASWSS